MGVLIGHASADERGKVSGGAAGDQTGREVCTRSWYAGSWNVLLRPKSAAVAEKMARFCEDVCANDNVGYDQHQRNTLRRAALLANWDGGKISTACETDCSAFMTVCAEAAGLGLSGAYVSGNAPTTWTLRRAFFATGAFDVLTDAKYLVSDRYLKRGDVLLRESGHTAMVLSDGAAASSAAAATATAPAQGTETAAYIVAPGDTLWAIAARYGTTVPALCAANKLDAAQWIYPGQKLVIP